MNRTFIMSDFYCTKCGYRGLSIPRKVGQARETRHIKDLLCIRCGERTKHIEVSETGSYSYFDFLDDFNSGAFKDGVD